MKIATRIAAGYLILIGLMMAVLGYELSLVHRLQSMNRDMAEQINTRAVIFSLQAGDLAQIEEFTRKFFLTADPAYNDQLQALRQLIAQDFETIQSMSLSEAERQEIERLSRLWDEFSKLAARHEAMLETGSGSLDLGVLVRELDHLGRLRSQTDRMIEANTAAINARAEQSRAAGQHAEWISRIAAVVALGIGVLASVLIIRSISKPLAQLTEGTRAVAEGKFSFRLNESGNHEFALLAGRFNRMTARLNELDEMKKDFVSHVSHELKTPLASIQETIRLLLEEIPGPLTEKQRRLLQLSLTSSGRLFSMIQDLLDVSRIEAGAMEYDFRNQDLVAVARTALEEFEVVAGGDHRIEVQLPEQP
ncbi:MAG: HAMP domain-containing protein, partial [Acidobacteria bacterium]|nr:HAMP domain-containing protein [Acidobacteriota bacterium]